MMRKIVTLLGLIAFMGHSVVAQQDAQFTKYMFNSLTFNPAYAGSKDHMTMGLIHRTQWWGIDGAPQTQSFTIHSPLNNERIGLGFSLVNDDIGPTHAFAANISYAYRIPIGNGKLSIGVQVGLQNWRANWSELNIENPDPNFDGSPNYWNPNFGAGVYYYSKHFYAGMGVPHLVEYDLRDKEDITQDQWAKQYRHVFFHTGVAIPIKGDALIFRPSLLIKTASFLSGLRKGDYFQNITTPNGFDLDMSLLFYQTLWIGAAYRSAFEEFNGDSSNDSVDIWASWLLNNGMRIGAAYDYTLTELQGPAKGSFEIMLGYEFNFKTKQLVTPRYF